MGREVHLTTCVWGPWHLDVMQHAMWPTLLSPNNLPALVGGFDTVYRIATTPDDRARMISWPIYRRLAETVRVEFVTERANPDITYHVDWYHQAIAQARAARALCLFLPPDVAWSDGTLGHAGDAFAAGKIASAMPYLRVVSETALAELRPQAPSASPLTIPPGDLVRFAIRHLHPLSAAALADGMHSRPSLEAIWRVSGEGLLFRHMVRELFAFDPNRIELTHLWYAGGGCRIEDVHVVTDSDDMFMLSFAPRLKDMTIYIPRHAVTPMDLGRQSLHPLNDTALTSAFARQPVRLHYGAMDDTRWRRAERRSDGFFKQAIVMREALRLWAALKQHGCGGAQRLLSTALQATCLARRWPDDGPVTVLAPNDAAIERLHREEVLGLAAPGASDALVRAVLGHVAAGVRSLPASGEPAQQLRTLDGRLHRLDARADGIYLDDDARVTASFDVPPHRICIIDRWLAGGFSAPQSR